MRRAADPLFRMLLGLLAVLLFGVAGPPSRAGGRDRSQHGPTASITCGAVTAATPGPADAPPTLGALPAAAHPPLFAASTSPAPRRRLAGSDTPLHLRKRVLLL